MLSMRQPSLFGMCRGVTLIELVIVMVIVSLLAISVSMGLNSSTQHRVNLRADEFRRAVSHAQLLAISQGKRLRMNITTGGYTVVECTNTACSTVTETITDPATGEPFSANLAADNITATAATIDFDSLGRPQSGGSLRTDSLPITFTGAGHSATVTILPITGFAQTSL